MWAGLLKHQPAACWAIRGERQPSLSRLSVPDRRSACCKTVWAFVSVWLQFPASQFMQSSSLLELWQPGALWLPPFMSLGMPSSHGSTVVIVQGETSLGRGEFREEGEQKIEGGRENKGLKQLIVHKGSHSIVSGQPPNALADVVPTNRSNMPIHSLPLPSVSHWVGCGIIAVLGSSALHSFAVATRVQNKHHVGFYLVPEWNRRGAVVLGLEMRS